MFGASNLALYSLEHLQYAFGFPAPAMIHQNILVEAGLDDETQRSSLGCQAGGGGGGLSASFSSEPEATAFSLARSCVDVWSRIHGVHGLQGLMVPLHSLLGNLASMGRSADSLVVCMPIPRRPGCRLSSQIGGFGTPVVCTGCLMVCLQLLWALASRVCLAGQS